MNNQVPEKETVELLCGVKQAISNDNAVIQVIKADDIAALAWAQLTDCKLMLPAGKIRTS